MKRRVLLVTGGAMGIGAEAVRLASRKGWAVCIDYRSGRKEAGDLETEIRNGGGDALSVQADISVENDVIRLFDAVGRQWGRLDGLVNNAGILERRCRAEAVTSDRLFHQRGRFLPLLPERMFATGSEISGDE